MDERTSARLVVWVVVGLLGGFAYLLWFRPLTAYEWLFRRRMSRWGVTTTLADERTFRRMAWLTGLLLAVIMGFVLWVSWACLGLADG